MFLISFEINKIELKLEEREYDKRFDWKQIYVNLSSRTKALPISFSKKVWISRYTFQEIIRKGAAAGNVEERK